MADYTVWSGSISGTPLQLARDLMAGCTDDYYFCRTGEYEYILVTCSDWDVSALIGDDCTVHIIRQLTGYGYNNGGYSLTTISADSVSISNQQNYIAYSSSEGFPHLIEGGELYAFSEILLLGICCCFFLADRIFRHVYSR